MSGLVTCDMLGSALIQWLNNATELQKDELCTALGCNDGALDNLLSQLRDCQGASLEGKRDLATCDDLAQATELNQGTDLPSDASDCDRPLSACGLTNILNGEDLNPLQQAVFKSWLNTYVNDTAARNIFLSTLISPQSGNRIEVRDDGIGVWDEAPPNLATQYVDAVGGNDGNAGTQASPLRTVAQAMRNIVNLSSGYGTFTIALRAGQTHVINEDLSHFSGITSYRFVGYGDPVFGWSDRAFCPGQYVFNIKEYDRPTLDIRPFTNDTHPEYDLLPYFTAASVRLNSVKLIVRSATNNYPGAATFPFNVLGLLQGLGSDISLLTGAALARPESVWLLGCNVFMEPGARFVDPLYSPVLTIDGARGESPQAACGDVPAHTIRAVNGRDELTPENLGFTVDASTKTIFNGGTSWDIFA